MNHETWTILHETHRYGETKGMNVFGSSMSISGVTEDQAESIAAALSGYFDAGLTDQFFVDGGDVI